MTEHDHDAQIEAYGECVTCATQPGFVSEATEAHALIRHDAPDTARNAAHVATLRSGGARWRVLVAISEMPRTDQEIQLALTMSESERPRRVECMDAGWIEDSGQRRLTHAGHESIVWRLTRAGEEVLKSSAASDDGTGHEPEQLRETDAVRRVP